jgi:hypothetical protein
MMWPTQTPLLRIVRPTGLTHLRFSPRITVRSSRERDTSTGAKSTQQMEGKKDMWWDMVRRLQENQLRRTQRGGVLHVREIQSLNLHTKTGYRIQIFAAVYSSSSEIVSTDYEIFFPVLCLGYVHGHYITWNNLRNKSWEDTGCSLHRDTDHGSIIA